MKRLLMSVTAAAVVGLLALGTVEAGGGKNGGGSKGPSGSGKSNGQKSGDHHKGKSPHSYKGKDHYHWSYWCWNSHYHCHNYWCPRESCYYYWYAPERCYYPLSYIANATPAPVAAPEYAPTAPVPYINI